MHTNIQTNEMCKYIRIAFGQATLTIPGTNISIPLGNSLSNLTTQNATNQAANQTMAQQAQGQQNQATNHTGTNATAQQQQQQQTHQSVNVPID